MAGPLPLPYAPGMRASFWRERGGGIAAPWLIGGGLGFGLLEALRGYAGAHAAGGPASWGEALCRTVPFWGTFGLLLAALAGTVRRFPLERGRWRRSLAVHLGIAVLFAIVHPLLAGLAIDASCGVPLLPWRAQAQRLFRLTPVVDFFSYAVFVSASSALAYHRKFIEEEREAARQALRAKELEARLAEARLDALRMQLNPHFLFNTLNATSVLALKGERDKVVTMLARLSDLLRTVLESPAQVVPLAEEIDLLSRYLEIERVRFEDRLTVLVEVDPDVLDAEVPVLVLQPLAENAIHHGIARHPGPGRVEVRGRGQGDRLVIEVRDSGPGFTETEARAGGVGLANTRARLAQLYSDAAELELSEAPGGGGLVRLSLPLRRPGE